MSSMIANATSAATSADVARRALALTVARVGAPSATKTLRDRTETIPRSPKSTAVRTHSSSVKASTAPFTRTSASIGTESDCGRSRASVGAPQ